MIKAVITDVDGVILGKQIGVNFPLPHVNVIQKLRQLKKAGIPIIFCSAKAGFANSPIIITCELDNPHIVDGGSVILDAINNVVIEKHMIPRDLTQKIWSISKENNFYQEFYTPSAYYVFQGQDQTIIEKRAIILRKDPLIVPSIENIPLNDVIKIQQLNGNRELLTSKLSKIEGTSFFVSAPYPTMPDLHIAVLTAEGVSKRNAAKRVFESLNISFNDAIGIGDSENDWEFMSLCKFIGVIGNAQDKLKEMARQKEEGTYFIGPSVEENGILNIFDFFIKSVEKQA